MNAEREKFFDEIRIVFDSAHKSNLQTRDPNRWQQPPTFSKKASYAERKKFFDAFLIRLPSHETPRANG